MLLSLLVSIIGSIVVSEIVFSFTEHQMHSRVMHKKTLPKWFYKKYPIFEDIFEGHAIRHHGIWYRDFDFEPNEAGRNDNIRFRTLDVIIIMTCLLPINALFFAVSPICGITFIVMLLIHGNVWNTIHTQMHLPTPAFFSNWGIYKWLAVHHYMHHQFTNKNYNIVFPLADYILGTKIPARRKDIRELLRLGYIEPKSARTKLILAKLRSQIATKREQQLALVS
ncbi:hypothetical protein H6F32_04775 [Anabaena sp. FACHB-1237]|uniref:hypothetical protein n=1 Tax=Anabaena sp. FACHB-1237 TaxID=2692769 RepID=UPI00168061D0|nr:hypothetical protein [Anabaena sp. FACHB-1237]MBD2136916.1 hypothetical protein [Anabaena sp. FACHB-1237]